MADGGEAQAESASTDVTTLLQMLVDDRQCREREFANKRACQTVEMERQVKKMKAQVDVMCRLIKSSAKSKSSLVRVAKLADTDDIEGYLLTFERQMAAYEVDKSRWPFILAPQLTGKAQKAYMALANEDAGNYGCIKQVILNR